MKLSPVQTAARLAETGLDNRIGYKLKDASMHDTAIYRWDGERWADLLNPALLLSAQDVLTLLAHGAANGEYVIPFGCCCFDCATDSARMAAQEFTAKTGLGISHGYWPGRCTEQMMKHYQA